jgi:hypothetical protein
MIANSTTFFFRGIKNYKFGLRSFTEKLKFDYEDPLNLNSLLTEEETMVKII